MSIVLANIVSTERNANVLTIMKQLRDPINVVERVEPRCLFTNFILCFKGTQRRQKQTGHVFALLKKMNLLPDK